MVACARLASDGSVSASSEACARRAHQTGSQEANRSAGSDTAGSGMETLPPAHSIRSARGIPRGVGWQNPKGSDKASPLRNNALKTHAPMALQLNDIGAGPL